MFSLMLWFSAIVYAFFTISSVKKYKQEHQEIKEPVAQCTRGMHIQNCYDTIDS